MGVDLIFLRAPMQRLKQLNLGYMVKGKGEDRIQNYLCEAVLHIINHASVKEIKDRVMKKYEGDPLKD